MPTSIEPSRSQRIVLIRPSALGDVCRTVPVLASLRAALPEAHIAWVVQDDFAPAIEAHPALSEVITFPRERLGKWWSSPARMLEARRWFANLRNRRFDVAIDCQGLGRSGLIARATRAPIRIGLRNSREFAWLGYNRRVPGDGRVEPRHTVDRMLMLLEPLGVPVLPDMRLYVSPDAKAWWSDQRRALSMSEGQPAVVIAPGSRWPSKRWPIERFVDLVAPVLDRRFERVLVIGSSAERVQAEPLLRMAGLSSSPVVDLVGRTSIAQTMAIIADAGLVLANDSAPLHMAVGFDRPCVALFGPTDPAKVGPYARAECVVRAYRPDRAQTVNYRDDRLGDSLMRLISTTMVLQAVDRVLSLWPQRVPMVHAPIAHLNQAVDSRGDQRQLRVASLPHGLKPEAAS